jgi:hypothetical protein
LANHKQYRGEAITHKTKTEKKKGKRMMRKEKLQRETSGSDLKFRALKFQSEISIEISPPLLEKL